MPSTSIQFMSDLHLEIERDRNADGQDLFRFEFEPRSSILALLGDIGTTVDERLFDWLKLQLSKFQLVLYVPGNHEPYWTSLEDSTTKLQEFAARYQGTSSSCTSTDSDAPIGRFILLDRVRYDLSQDITILGCTLWSHLNPEDLDILRWGLNDFKRISDFTPETYESAHARDVSWLEASIRELQENEPHRKIVVMTHHAPTVQGTSPEKFLGGPMNSAFCTELIGSQSWAQLVKVWMFGHTHWNCDFEMNGVRILSNQRGYGGGADGFDPEGLVDV